MCVSVSKQKLKKLLFPKVRTIFMVQAVQNNYLNVLEKLVFFKKQNRKYGERDVDVESSDLTLLGLL